jgi:Methyltransferase domain
MTYTLYTSAFGPTYFAQACVMAISVLRIGKHEGPILILTDAEHPLPRLLVNARLPAGGPQVLVLPVPGADPMRARFQQWKLILETHLSINPGGSILYQDSDTVWIAPLMLLEPAPGIVDLTGQPVAGRSMSRSAAYGGKLTTTEQIELATHHRGLNAGTVIWSQKAYQPLCELWSKLDQEPTRAGFLDTDQASFNRLYLEATAAGWRTRKLHPATVSSPEPGQKHRLNHDSLREESPVALHFWGSASPEERLAHMGDELQLQLALQSWARAHDPGSDHIPTLSEIAQLPRCGSHPRCFGDEPPCWPCGPGANSTDGLEDLILEQGLAELKSPIIVETGTHRGVSTATWALMLPLGSITTIDNKPCRSGLLSRLPNVRQLRGDSIAMAATFPLGSLDAVYLDTDHSEPALKAEIAAWLPRLKPGGLLCGHDYSPRHPGVIAAVFALKNGPPDHIYSDSSWAIRLRLQPADIATATLNWCNTLNR